LKEEYSGKYSNALDLEESMLRELRIAKMPKRSRDRYGPLKRIWLISQLVGV